MSVIYHAIGIALLLAGSWFITFVDPSYEEPVLPISLLPAVLAGPIEETLAFGIPFYLSSNHYVVLITGSLWALAHILNTDSLTINSLAYANVLFAVPHVFLSLRTWVSGKGWFAIVFHSAWNGMAFTISCGAGEIPCSVIGTDGAASIEMYGLFATIIAAEALLFITYLLYYRKRRNEIRDRSKASISTMPHLAIMSSGPYGLAAVAAASDRPTKIWYLLPILLGIVEGLLGVIGGLIMYFKLRKRDPRMARNGLLVGIILLVVKFAITGAIFFGTVPDLLPSNGLRSDPQPSIVPLPTIPISNNCPLDYRNIATIPVGTDAGNGSLYGLAVNSITNKVFVAHTTSQMGEVVVIDGSSDAVVKRIQVADGQAFDLDGIAVNHLTNKIYVVSSYGQTLWAIDGTTDSVVKAIPVGKYAIGVGVDTSTNKIYVASNGDGTVSVIEGGTDTRINTVSMPTMPRFVSANSNMSRIYVFNFRDSTIGVIDGAENDKIMEMIALPSESGRPGGLVVNPATNKVYVAFSGVTVIDGDTMKVLHSISLGEHLGTFDLAVNQETNEIFAGISNRYPGQVAIIDGNNDTLTKKIEVGDKPIGIGVNTVTGKVYVANSNDETVSVIAKTTECRT